MTSIYSQMKRCLFLLTFLMLTTGASHSFAASSAGYSEFYVPGDEDDLIIALEAIGSGGQGLDTHSVIGITTWAANTVVYYDHWEDGYDFDYNDLTTADETFTLAAAGDFLVLEDGNITTPRSANIPDANCTGVSGYCYDGRDRIIVAGGTATVSRASWSEATGIVLAVAWEVYPVSPQLTHYILPFGEDLGGDFNRVFTLIMATEDGTRVTVDYTGDGIPDPLNIDRSGGYETAYVDLDKGESFLLDNVSINDTTTTFTLDTGTEIQGTKTLQVQYIIGDEGSSYEIRGLSAFPRGFWDDEYYAPVDRGGPGLTNSVTEIYLHNPHTTSLTIDYQSSDATLGNGQFTVPAGQTIEFSVVAGAIPVGTALYFKGSDVFWGVSTIDKEQVGYDWAYSLVPASLLDDEHFMGWAPSSRPITAGQYDASGLFISPAQDNTHLYIDRDGDGVSDEDFILNRLQTHYSFDDIDGDMSGARIWATSPFTLAYGQNPAYANYSTPAIDVGYTSLPGNSFIDMVLDIEKTADPVVVSTATGSQSTYTLTVNSADYSVDGVSITDSLPVGWQYVTGTTTITLADLSQITPPDPAAEPNITGSAAAGWILTWPKTTLGDMAENQQITVTFTAETTQVFATGAMTRNEVEAIGTRTVGTVTQTFTTSDSAFNTYGSLDVTKTSSGVDPLYPGDQFTYTVTVTNPATATANLTGIGIYDPLPAGTGYVAGSSYVDLSTFTGTTFSYDFESGAQGFTVGAADGDVLLTNWELGDPTSFAPATGSSNCNSGTRCYGAGPDNDHTPTGVNCWGTDLDALYSNNIGGIYLYSPVYDFTGFTDVQLSFWEWMEIEGNNYDYTRLQYSLDGGATWVNAFVYGDTESSRVDTTWSQFNHDASSYAGSQASVQWRWMIDSDGSWQWGGWYIDDVVVQAASAPPPYPGAAGDPPNFIQSSDGYSLAPGQSLILTYDVTIDDPLAAGITSITNVASVNSNEISLPSLAEVTNIVVNPSASMATVGELIWLDSNGDGIKNVGEPGLSGVEITLKDQFGTPVAVTTTNTTGVYQFTGVPAGTGYYIEATASLPSGVSQSAPAGRNDNRSNSFDLVAGLNYTGANLGYTPDPTTATLGNLIWSDANGDGVVDAGEPGIGGVTVTLYLDDGDGLFSPTLDTLVGTTTTATDGSYLFTGITPTGSLDYFVFADPAQTALSGYTASTGTSFLNVDVAGGDVLLNNDVGFQPNAGTGYAIQDRIWFDENANGIVDGTESGIAGVTVDLLDASGNIITSTTTDANGDLIFSGVPAGANYTIRVTDTAGVLTNYYGTTADALAGERVIVNLSADESGNAGFGYNLTSTIGDSVFNDLNGNGVQDTGEPGISGVLVELQDGTCIPGSTCPTLTSDTNGQYLFTGLADGTYDIYVDGTQTPLTGLTVTTPSGTPSDTRTATITGGNTTLDIDFGYRAPTPRTISGTLWDDVNSDGVIDPGESGLAGVTVDLLRAGVVVTTVTTDANGLYSFAGLAIDTYTVKITDTSGILNGYDTTYETTEGTTPPFNGEESVDVTGGDQTTIRFGYNKPVPTLAVIASFRAYNDSGQMLIEWQTASELGTVGFYLQRFDQDSNRYRSVNKKMLPGLLHAPQGGTYRFVDTEVVPGPQTYKLVEIEVKGRKRMHGPYAVTPVSLPHARSSSPDIAAANSVAANVTVMTSPANTKSAIFSSQPHKTGKKLKKTIARKLLARSTFTGPVNNAPVLKIAIQERGIYFLPAETLSSSLGLSWSDAPRKNFKRLKLTNRGRRIPAFFAQNGIYFYGEPVDSIYTGKNVYRLTLHKKPVRKQKKVNKKAPKGELFSSGIPLEPVQNQTFRDAVHIESDIWPVTGLINDPEADFWMWDYIVADSAPKNFTVPSPGIAATDTARLTINFLGATDTAAELDHHARILVNGYEAGETTWAGTSAHSVTLDIDQWMLNDGDNTVQVTGVLPAGAPYSIFYVDSFDLIYHREYEAKNNILYLRGDTNTTVTVDGFTTPDIDLYDISTPTRPSKVKNLRIDEIAGTFRVTFIPSSPESEYLALTGNAILSATETYLDQPSSLRRKTNKADYIIIAPAEFTSAMLPLADIRAQQGLRPMIVDIEDIYDEFNYSIASPHAIRRFLRYAYKRWQSAPQYVVLGGNGTYDFKDVLGYNDNPIPPIMVGTEYGLFASDTFLADVVNNDGIPEMAIGRIPASTEMEMATFVNKLTAYEAAGSGSRSKHITLLADNPDAGGNFIIDSEQLATHIPSSYTTDKIYLPEHTLAEAQQLTRDSLNAGARLVNFIGHAGLDRLTSEGMLTSNVGAQLTNGNHLPVLLAMTCMTSRFDIPGYATLGKQLLFNADGGINGLWSSTGFSLNNRSVQLNNIFFANLFTDQQPVIGDLIRQSLTEQYRSMSGYNELLDLYNYLGDPAMRLQ